MWEPSDRRNTFNAKVCKKMGFQLTKEELDALCNCQSQEISAPALHP